MSFDPKRHVIKVQGNREYLPVSARLVWFRSEHPDWGIVTTAVEINLTPENGRRPYAIFQAQIFNAEGRLMATATKMEDERGFPDFLEKAETGSVGRALAMCGFGTQFAPELEESSRGDNYGGGGNRYQGNYASRPNTPGNGASRPMQTAAPQQNRPAPAPAPPPVEDDEPYEAPSPRTAVPAPAPANGAAAAPRTPPQGRVAPTGASIQRVREPEPDDLPIPDDEDEEEDPFADEDEPGAPPAASRPAAARPASAPAETVSNQCAAEGCNALLTPAQLTMSINKFGKPLCLTHQKEMAPATAGAAPSGGRRNSRSSGGDTLL